MFGGHVNVVQASGTNGVTLEGFSIGQYVCSAASLNNMDVLQALGRNDNQFLSVPNNHGQTTLHAAMVLDNFPMVQYLVESGVQMDQNDIDSNSPYDPAKIHGGDEILSYTLHLVMLQYNFHMVQYLVQGGIPIDQNDVHGMNGNLSKSLLSLNEAPFHSARNSFEEE
ncbi:hypothetical protein TSUD_89300 [Trifolium subterraneum]|uniref:Uncharacterized protein n=1 Tax=Trifolium subterraneum TaxID=3900 RepID=A0A2Z6MSF3_TRISU|nr:hypothetical protein TSUD_89300 [Trifolium subterraneum]